MKILIFGASGATGQHLVRNALDKGHKVTAFVRNPDKLSLTHPQLTLAPGNVKDPETVRQAIIGQHAVLSALGANNMFKFDQDVVEGMAIILHAMAFCTVKRLVYLSTLGVGETRRTAGIMIRNLAPTILRTEVKGHELREKMIQQSQSDWTIVRAPILADGPLTEKYRFGEKLESANVVTALSRADVAEFMLSQLTDQRFTRKSVSLMPC